jgi:arthrofactin-type cyclic lipopeptide synthetase C
VQLESLPLTPNGKLDRRALPAPEADAYVVHDYEPPQGPIEVVISLTWADIMKVERIGRHDNFFELGGHSLLALRVSHQLQQLGLDLSVTDIITQPTLKLLAQRATFGTECARAHRAVLIRKGTGPSPLFMTHCGGLRGELLYLPALAPHIDSATPIYGLPAIHIDDSHPRTIEGMASRMVAMIRAVQPTGPYRIAGWSFGGLLAYEIAVQLIGSDQEVEFVGLLDTRYLPGIHDSPLPAVNDLDEKVQLLLQVKQAADRDKISQKTIDEVLSCAQSLDYETLVQKCREAFLIPPQYSQLTTSQIRKLLSREHLYHVAMTHYSALPIPIQVTLFVAQITKTSNPVMGWDSVLPERLIRIVPIEGTHHSMMRKPTVQSLGLSISQAVYDAATAPKEIPEKYYFPAITLQTGRSDTDPMFWIPGAGNSATSLIDLVPGIGCNHSIYGLQPRGLDGKLVPHSTISAIANSYIVAINKIHPTGPIHLLGHSFGGWIALELARRLSQSGRHIVSLTILDSEAPDNDDARSREYDNTDALMEWLSIFELILERPLKLNRADLERRVEAEQVQLIHRCLVAEGVLPKRSTSDQIVGALRTFATSIRAPYRPTAIYTGAAHLIVADDPRHPADVNLKYQHQLLQAWTRWLPNMMYTHASGNHITMLKEPNVNGLASSIQRFCTTAR